MSDVTKIIGGILGPILGPILGGAGNNLAGKLTGSTNVPFVPQGLGMADRNWQQMYGQVWDQMQQSNPQLAAQLQQAFQGAQQQAPQIQGLYNQLAQISPLYAQAMLQQAGTMGQGQQQLMAAGQNLNQMAQDPQNALRQRYQQQLTEASRAGTSARGIGMGPQAAGMESDTINKFLQDWQNQQVARGATGLQGMTNAYGQAGALGQNFGRDLTGAMAFSQMQPQLMQQGAQYPFDIANQYGAGLQSNIYGPMESSMLSGQNYMNTGVPATGQAFAANQSTLGNMLYGMGQLGQLFGGGQQNAPPGYYNTTAPSPADYGQYF